MPDSLRDANVPIVGQGVRVIGYTVLPMVMCDCGHLEPLPLVLQVAAGQTMASLMACPRCQTTYRVVAMDMDTRKQLRFQLDQQKPVTV